MIIAKGATDVSVYYYIRQDASATSPGEPVTGLLFSDIETGGSASYARQGGARVDLTLITLASASAVHADGGFILVDDTNMPGLYRCDYPDAAFVTGVDVVTLQIVIESTNNAVADPIFVQLTGVDLQDTVRAGLTALPNAAADAAGGLATSAGGATGIDDLATPTNITAGTITTTTNLTNLPSIPANWITTAGITDGAYTAAKFAANSLDGKGDWNIGKTGYSLTQAFPTNFADMSIVITTGLVDITQAAADKAWSTASRQLTALQANIIAASSFAAGAIDATAIGTGAIDADAIAANAIGASELATDAIGDDQIATGAIATTAFAAGAIDAAAIAADAIGASELATDAIGAAQLATDAVDEIRDGLLPTQNATFDNIMFLLVAASDHVTPVTGATGLAVTRSIDGAAFGAGTGTLAEVANGIYQYDASAADMNGGIITFRFVATGGTPGAADDRFLTIVTGGGV